ncbi:MAG: hypothetical protein RJB66_1617 [Pseudomonadota bacterium]|jgi:murein L,D-transpeptidase YcbB/YkuD
MLRSLKNILFITSLFVSVAPALALNSSELREMVDKPEGRLAKLAMGGGVVYDTTVLRSLYRMRNFKPLWYGEVGFTSRLSEMRNLLRRSYEQGLDAKAFWRPEMEAFFSLGNEMSEIEFEIAVAEAAIRYAKSISVGQIDPSLVDDDIKLAAKPFADDALKILNQVFDSDPKDLANGFQKFEPTAPLYRALKNQLISNKDKFSEDQINKIRASMEKLRWFPQDLGERYAMVNLAQTELRVIEKGVPVLSMRTVNGRPIRRTPMMIDSMKRVELNPTWTVPLNLAIWDKLPRIREDVGFLSRLGIEVFQPGSDQPVSDVASINWNQLSRDYFPYILRQQAGPTNVLGKVKFPLNNGFSIYMHDTDERGLFSQAGPRLRSSGCIRLQKPMEMAAYLLKNQTVPKGRGWLMSDGSEFPSGSTFTEDILMSRVAKNQDTAKPVTTISINVEKPLPVYTAYLTADVDEQGRVQFVNDLYKQDERLLSMLNNLGNGDPRLATRVTVSDSPLVPVQINGELGPTQLFGEVIAIRCVVWPYKGCVDVDDQGKQTREEYRFNLNEEIHLPAGHYILGSGNTMLPGWLEVVCAPDELSQCAPVVVRLERIEIPKEFTNASEVIVYRDMTSVVEINKALSQGFHNGRALIKQTPIGYNNFYLPGVNQPDVVQRLTNDYCVPILRGQVSDVAPEVRNYCDSLSEVVGMAEYVDLPVVIHNELSEGSSDQVKSSRTMKVFGFPKNTDKGRLFSQWNQRWVGAPGTWIDFKHQRYLVAAPLFLQNIPAGKRFVSVLPGQYQVLASGSQGEVIGQKTVRTENIDENYERVARKVMLGE